MLIATVAILTVLVTFDQFPNVPMMFNIPAGEVNYSMYSFVTTIDNPNWLWSTEHPYIATNEVRGMFTPCDALRKMIGDAPVELWNPDTNTILCAPPRPPKKSRRIIPTRIIDAPIRRRSCECLEISRIPIPWCENEEGKLINDHGCA